MGKVILLKPKKLKIKGLNSFIEQQEIDFERLTEKGLFGIFGPTGSGKSTILDAITIALYGKIARDSTEFINTDCDNLSVSYEFEIGGTSDRRCYIVDRNVKKDKNGRYKTTLARLVDASSGNVVAEAAREVQGEIESIIGLTCDDFTRSVVLPQGKFNEFLRLTGRERRDMLERIFGLEKYGKHLGEKIKRARNGKLKSLDILSGEMKRFEGFSEETYLETKKLLNKMIDEEKILRSEKKQLEDEYEKYKILWELQEELEVFKKREEELKLQIPDVNSKRDTVQKANNALKVKPYIVGLRTTEEKLKLNENQLVQLVEALKEIELRLSRTEEEYKIAAERKEKEVPILIRREANLIQAIDIKLKTQNIEKERGTLLKEYEEKKNLLKVIKEGLDNLTLQREKNLKEIESKENRLSDIKVEPEYREKLQRAFLKEEEYKVTANKKSELEKKIHEKTNKIYDIQKHKEDAIKIKENKDKELLMLESKRKLLIENCPGDNSLLLEKQNQIAILRESLETALENTNKKNELQDKLIKVLEQKEQLDNKIRDIKKIIETKSDSYKVLSEEIAKLERINLASILAKELKENDPCPVCGSVHHPSVAAEVDNDDITEKSKVLDQMKLEIDDYTLEERKYEIELAGVYKQEEYLKEEYDTLLRKLKDIDLETLKLQNNRVQAEFNNIKTNIDRWNSSKEETERLLQNCREEKVEIDKSEIKLSELLSSEKTILREIELELKACLETFEKVSKEYTSFKEELKIDNIKLRLDEIMMLDKESAKIQNGLKELRERTAYQDREKEELAGKINEAEIEIAKILRSGKEKRAAIDGYNEEMNKLSEGREPSSYLTEIRKLMSSIQEHEEKIKSKLEAEKLEKQKVSDKKLSEQQDKLTLEKLFSEQKNSLEEALRENSFGSIEEAIAAALEEQAIEEFDKEIKSFEDSLKNTAANIDRIRLKLGDNRIELEEWQRLEVKRKEVYELLDEKVREIARCQQMLQVMDKELERLKELLKEKKSLEHVCSLLDDLDKLVQGNKFVEFVAMNQLRYIALEASKRLKDITRGRYALELDSSGNFTMRDDFNGGVVRPTNTLSGGETFLTSLSLALSLSSQIQLKGSAPLEFFFLDEGFGTLDTNLLETVMGSLERLHSDRLSVGIISHVEELKNRVPVKLIVEPAMPGQGGSKIKIEYS